MGGDRFLNPTVLYIDLNEWLRFSRPGIYWISVSSSRVSSRTVMPGSLIVTSNRIKLTIVEQTRDWVSQELSKALQDLDSASTTATDKETAAKRLRYLNTVSSTVAIVKELAETTDEEWHFPLTQGLLESSWRVDAIRMLHNVIDDAKLRVSWDAVDLLAELTLVNEYENRPLPAYREGDPAGLKNLQDAVSERQREYGRLLATYTVELRGSLRQRVGRPRADAIFALWKDQEVHSGDFSSVELADMRREIVSLAADLTPSQQAWVFSIYWGILPNREKLLPVLKTIASANRPIPVNWAGGDLRRIARECWCELDSSGCTQR